MGKKFTQNSIYLEPSEGGCIKDLSLFPDIDDSLRRLHKRVIFTPEYYIKELMYNNILGITEIKYLNIIEVSFSTKHFQRVSQGCLHYKGLH